MNVVSEMLARFGIPALAVALMLTGFAFGQKSSSIVIHDSTGAGAGGENATSGLRSEFKAALEREKPCVETMDDDDIRDAIQDERERAMLEGGDSDAALRAIGEKMGASLVMSVKALPGAGGTTTYSSFAMDNRSARTVARDMGSDPKQVAENMVRQLGPYLADTCKPHWIGIIRYVYSSSESKQKTDAGPMRTASRNVRRKLTETSEMTTTIKATLQKPNDDKSVSSPMAQVSHRVRFVFTKNSSTSGELYCRVPGKNPYFKGFSEEYSETLSQLGQGTELMQVFILVDEDGTYTIKVNAPGGTLIGKNETRATQASCEDKAPEPKIEAMSLPPGKFDPTSFEATGKTDPKSRDRLAGSQNLPDGKTKITWNLRLVKPKGK